MKDVDAAREKLNKTKLNKNKLRRLAKLNKNKLGGKHTQVAANKATESASAHKQQNKKRNNNIEKLNYI